MPAGSSQILLGDVAAFRNGLNFSKEARGAGCPFVGIPAFSSEHSLDYALLPTVSGDDIASDEDYLRSGDIIFVRSNGNKELVGRSIIIQSDEPALFSGFCIRARIDASRIEPLFAYYYSKTRSFRKQLAGTSGSNIQNLNQTVLGQVGLPRFSMAEQKKIAAVLSALDAKIDLNNRINAELEALAKTIYDYWFVQFDFPDANGRPYKTSGGKMEYNPTLKREIPAGWAPVPLGQLVACNANSIGAGNLPDEIVYLDTGNLTNNRLFQLETFNTKTDEIPSRAKRLIAQNDVLYSTVRPNQNHHGIIKDRVQNLVGSTGFAVLTCVDKHLNGDFLYLFLQSSDISKKLQRIAALSKSSYPSIAPDDLLQLQLALPQSRAPFEKFCEFLDQTFKTVWSNEKQNRELTQLRDWLLPLLMNGQVKVS